jgi:putative ABC transport system permease protein
MLMSTYERLKEFGTLRAIGASRFTVLGMILTESLLLSLAGGVLGIVLGIMGSRLLDSAVVTLFQLSYPVARISVSLVLQALGLSLAVGVVGAIIPCFLVYRMNIIYALRQE